jgi:hypothetical protein
VDCDGVGEGEFIEFSERVVDIALIESNDEFLFDRIDGVDGADIAIENLLVVIIFQLHDLVTNLEAPTEAVDMGFVRACGVQGLLEVEVKFPDAE